MISDAVGDARRKRGRPRQDEGPDPRLILNAALSAFARYGWDGTDLRKIARMAGVDSALIARRYEGKIGLWRAIVDNVSETLKCWQQGTDLTGLSIREQLALTIERFVILSLEQPDLGRFFIDQIAEVGERRNYVLEHIWLLHRRQILPLLEEAKAQGALPQGCDPETFHSMLVGAVSMPLLARSVALPDVETEEGRHRFVQNVLGLFAS